MRKRTELMKSIRQWLPITRELHGLAADGSLELLTLRASEVEDLRLHAANLADVIGQWQATHRPAAVTHNTTQEA